MFKYDTSFDTDETYSMRQSSTYNQTYFTANIFRDDQSLNANFYLNEMSELPENVLIYDYFGSGEMYYSPNGISSPIVSVSKSSLDYMYKWLTATASNASEYADSVIFLDKDYSEILATIIPLEISSCWVKPAYGFQNYLLLHYMPNLFNYELNDNSVNSSPPICSHVTYVSPSKEYISDHYQFANMIDGYPSCSHPSFADKHMPCHFFENFSLCPMHESKSEIITQVSVNHANTDNSTVFSVRKVHLSNMEYSYSVFNNTENQTVFNVIVPPETSELEASSHVTQLLEELLDSYKEDTIQILPDSLQPESKQPFIASALS